MAFKDPHDIWSKEEPQRYSDEPIEGIGWGVWTIILLVVIPWIVGIGVIVSNIFNL